MFVSELQLKLRYRHYFTLEQGLTTEMLFKSIQRGRKKWHGLAV